VSRSFSGMAERKLDYKGRVAIPDDLLAADGRGLRRAIVLRDSTKLEVSKGQETRFISIFDTETWQEMLAQAHRIMDGDEIRFFMDKTVGEIATVDLDATRRITVPERLLQYAGIDRQSGVKLVGAVTHIEIWAPRTYELFMEAIAEEGISVPSVAELAARTFIQPVLEATS
jgi:DNA-binding transcriptional regulator/RsmH inhibitor MraZ